jgi:hypothetical protein
MNRLLASFLLASSLFTASFAKTAPSKPVPVDIQIELDRAQVRAKLEARRKEVIERFLAYREARVYPWNRFVPSTRHLWFDDLGNLCAAATLISDDWGRDSTMKVGEIDRGIQLALVKNGELADWILTSGLTHHEIVAIQAPSIGVDDPRMRNSEIQRLYALYTDVERQLRTLGDENLDLATDALMKRPDLARELLAGKLPGPGKYTVAPVEISQ